MQINNAAVELLLSPTFFMITSSNGNIFRVTGPLCGEFTGPGEFPTQRPVTRSFDVFFDLHLNKRLSKQPWGWWFETPSWSLWRHCNVYKHMEGRNAIYRSNCTRDLSTLEVFNLEYRLYMITGNMLLPFILRPEGYCDYLCPSVHLSLLLFYTPDRQRLVSIL